MKINRNSSRLLYRTAAAAVMALVFLSALLLAGCGGLGSVIEDLNVLSVSAGTASDGQSDSVPEYDVSLLCTVEAIPDADGGEPYTVLRGGYTDGESVFVALHNGSNTDPRCAIIKIDPTDSSVSVAASGIVAGSITDLCYNPAENTVIAVHGAPDLQRISVFDADSFELIKTVTLMIQIDAMTYDPAENVYYAGIAFGCNFAKINADFRIIGTRVGTSHSHVRTGMDFIDGNIHFVTREENSIRCYTTGGEYVDSATAVFERGLIAGSPENVMHIGDVIYIGCSDASDGTMRIYSLTPAAVDTATEGGADNAEA